jgi:hypothetical protein
MLGTAYETDTAMPLVVRGGTAVEQVTAQPGKVLTGGASVQATVQITTEGEVRPGASKVQLTGIGVDVTHGVTVLIGDLTDEPDAACLIELRDLDGNVLVQGVGQTAADAVASIFEHMLPPTSGEYLPPDEGMPGHDTL